MNVNYWDHGIICIGGYTKHEERSYFRGADSAHKSSTIQKLQKVLSMFYTC